MINNDFCFYILCIITVAFAFLLRKIDKLCKNLERIENKIGEVQPEKIFLQDVSRPSPSHIDEFSKETLSFLPKTSHWEPPSYEYGLLIGYDNNSKKYKPFSARGKINNSIVVLRHDKTGNYIIFDDKCYALSIKEISFNDEVYNECLINDYSGHVATPATVVIYERDAYKLTKMGVISDS